MPQTLHLRLCAYHSVLHSTCIQCRKHSFGRKWLKCKVEQFYIVHACTSMLCTPAISRAIQAAGLFLVQYGNQAMLEQTTECRVYVWPCCKCGSRQRIGSSPQTSQFCLLHSTLNSICRTVRFMSSTQSRRRLGCSPPRDQPDGSSQECECGAHSAAVRLRPSCSSTQLNLQL